MLLLKQWALILKHKCAVRGGGGETSDKKSTITEAWFHMQSAAQEIAQNWWVLKGLRRKHSKKIKLYLQFVDYKKSGSNFSCLSIQTRMVSIKINYFTSKSSSYFCAYSATLSQICDLIRSNGPVSSVSLKIKHFTLGSY